MGSFSLSGGVEVFGFISPSNTADQYPVIDPLYGIDGLRNVNTLNDLINISSLRRRAGMIVGVSGGTIYYKLKPSPWNNTISDWEVFATGGGTLTGDYLPLSGGTVSGNTIFSSGLTIYNLSGFSGNNINLESSITPTQTDNVDLGLPLLRFRDVNTLSGTSSYWTSTVKVITPEIDLGLDSLGNSRIINADTSVINNDTLNGGIF